MTINGKASKVMVPLPFSDVLETAKEKINKFKYHPFVRNKQYRIYNNLKLQMTGNTIFLYVDNVEIIRIRSKVSVSQLTLGTHH